MGVCQADQGDQRDEGQKGKGRAEQEVLLRPPVKERRRDEHSEEEVGQKIGEQDAPEFQPCVVRAELDAR